MLTPSSGQQRTYDDGANIVWEYGRCPSLCCKGWILPYFVYDICIILQQVLQLWRAVFILKRSMVSVTKYLVAGAALTRHDHKTLVVAEIDDVDIVLAYYL